MESQSQSDCIIFTILSDYCIYSEEEYCSTGESILCQRVDSVERRAITYTHTHTRTKPHTHARLYPNCPSDSNFVWLLQYVHDHEHAVTFLIKGVGSRGGNTDLSFFHFQFEVVSKH